MIAERWLCGKVIGKTEQGSVSGLVGGVFTERERVSTSLYSGGAVCCLKDKILCIVFWGPLIIYFLFP